MIYMSKAGVHRWQVLDVISLEDEQNTRLVQSKYEELG